MVYQVNADICNGGVVSFLGPAENRARGLVLIQRGCVVRDALRYAISGYALLVFRSAIIG